MSGHKWVEANFRLLTAEFARIAARLAAENPAEAEAQVAAVRAEMPAPPAIDFLVQMFGLSQFERDVLLWCAGIEMDSRLAAIAAATRAAGVPSATFGQALSRFEKSHWGALVPISPLRSWRLIELQDDRALTSTRISIDERVLHYVAGINFLDPRLRSIVTPQAVLSPLSDSQAAAVTACIEQLGSPDTNTLQPPLIQLNGDDFAAQVEAARRIAEFRRLRLHVLRARDIASDSLEAAAQALLWTREAALLDSALLIRCEAADSQLLRNFLRTVGGTVFVVSTDRIFLERPELSFRVDKPLPVEQAPLWRESLGQRAALLNGSLGRITSQFRLATESIQRTAESLRDDPLDPETLETALREACGAGARLKLEELAQRIEPAACWRDLVLPEPQTATLRQIAAHFRQRTKVYEEWGFGTRGTRGLGISCLFTGESGTGKTMAAEVLAKELKLDLYRIDLSATVSKYIGETEKNLRRIFDAAEDSGAILLFDEADALFGKRSEVSDSHDRYANIEVSYLLQRVESYRGLAILTTNLKTSIDTAFLRRLRFVVNFPFPDQTMRERIWRGAFPIETPLAGIDHGKLAQLCVAGGSIRNIALNAAFLAADTGKPLDMQHLLSAARTDAAKRERPFSDAETRAWS